MADRQHWETNQNDANAAAQLLVEFNQLQAENEDGSQHQKYPMYNTAFLYTIFFKKILY